jgi:site-specific DNA recombinase
MTAAIYARKSTTQEGRNEEQKSVTRQVDNARAFAETNGWHVPDDFVFIDDGISGAEFERRPGFMRMMAARTTFDVLIVSERKSIGREMTKTSSVIQDLAAAGVEVFEYVHGCSLTPKTLEDKLLGTVAGW